MKKIISVLLAAVLCLSFCACSMPGKVEGSGYKSPEEALLAYAEALKTYDTSKILSTFAVETFVENYDLEAYLDRIHVYSITMVPYVETVDDFTWDLNLAARQQAITKNLVNMCACFSMGSDYFQITNPVQFNGNPYGDAGDLLDDIDTKNWAETLADMEISDDFVYLDDLLDSSDIAPAEKNLEKQCDFYGCDEIVPLALEVELDGDDYLLYMDVARYGDKWYNLNQGGLLASVSGIPAGTGGIFPDE